MATAYILGAAGLYHLQAPAGGGRRTTPCRRVRRSACPACLAPPLSPAVSAHCTAAPTPNPQPLAAGAPDPPPRPPPSRLRRGPGERTTTHAMSSTPCLSNTMWVGSSYTYTLSSAWLGSQPASSRHGMEERGVWGVSVFGPGFWVWRGGGSFQAHTTTLKLCMVRQPARPADNN